MQVAKLRSHLESLLATAPGVAAAADAAGHAATARAWKLRRRASLDSQRVPP
jgi:hypothetical protein